MRFQKDIESHPINKAVLNVFLLLVIAVSVGSCITTKATLALTESYDYKIKKVHAEPLNSSYGNLIDDYYEGMKTQDQKLEEAFQKDTLAFMQKTACLAKCPVYRITIYNNGNAKFEGEENVELLGIYQSKLEIEQRKKLTELLERVSFLEMPRMFPRAITIDAKSSITQMVLSNGEFKFPFTINYGEPQEITNIQLYLDQLVNEISWVQI